MKCNILASASYSDAGGEQNVLELTGSVRRMIGGIWVDTTNLTKDGTFKGYYKVDGTNYRQFMTQAYDDSLDGPGIYFDLQMGIVSDFKITYTEASDEGAIRAIPYQIVCL